MGDRERWNARVSMATSLESKSCGKAKKTNTRDRREKPGAYTVEARCYDALDICFCHMARASAARDVQRRRRTLHRGSKATVVAAFAKRSRVCPSRRKWSPPLYSSRFSCSRFITVISASTIRLCSSHSSQRWQPGEYFFSLHYSLAQWRYIRWSLCWRAATKQSFSSYSHVDL